MTAEYGPYSLLGSDIADRVDPEALRIIAESRACHGMLERQRYTLSSEEVNAYSVLGQLILEETVKQVFPTGSEDTPSLTDDEIGELLAAIEGMSAVESARHNSTPTHWATKIRKSLNRKFGTGNLTVSVFKSIIQGVILVSPRKDKITKLNLAPKKLETLGFIAQGLTNAQIGRKMYCTEVSASTYVASLFTELDAHSRPQAVYKAFESGIFQLPVEVEQSISPDS